MTKDICVCGHLLQDHHRSWLPNGVELIEECEFYGWNELGGMKLNEETATWLPHCYKFRRSGATDNGN